MRLPSRLALAAFAAISLPITAQAGCVLPTAWQPLFSRIEPGYETGSSCTTTVSGTTAVCTYPNGGTTTSSTTQQASNQYTASIVLRNVPEYAENSDGSYNLSRLIYLADGTLQTKVTFTTNGVLTGGRVTGNETFRFTDGYSSTLQMDYSFDASGTPTSGSFTANNATVDVSRLVACGAFSGATDYSFEGATYSDSGTTVLPPVIGDPNRTVAAPVSTQTSYSISTGRLPAAAVSVSASGRLGAATVTVELDLTKVLAANQFSAGYNAYLAAKVPGRQIGTIDAAWFMKRNSGAWANLGNPIAAFLSNVAVGSADQRIRLEIVRDTDLSALIGTEIYLGYGTSDQEMLSSGRYRGVYIINQQ